MLAAFTAELEAIEDELNEEFQAQYVRLRIKDGGQWEDSTGDMGTWEVEGNLLTFYRDNNDELNTRYFLSTNELVLNLGLLEFLELEDEDFDDEDRELFTAIFEEDASFQIILQARGVVPASMPSKREAYESLPPEPRDAFGFPDRALSGDGPDRLPCRRIHGASGSRSVR